MGLFGRSLTLKKKKKEEPVVSGPVLTSNAPSMNTTPIGSTAGTTSSSSTSSSSTIVERTRNDGQCFNLPFPEDATSIPPILEHCFNEIKDRGMFQPSPVRSHSLITHTPSFPLPSPHPSPLSLLL
eukprot:TRINITY_DN9777_c0_g1_i1.p1 TRINITY_DN9777_c0_g1~~TRINITY_DN9777_c0_g1_i1.p1  ORF type:complete len:146 (+),score=17.99 TRINITY_DN9777_c0_g1_i1:61-438(+)